MRHRKKLNHLSRKSSHRNSMLANMASSLIMHKRITTTTAKAKALRIYVEPLITRSKEDTTHSRRVVFSHLKDKTAVAELFREVSPKVAERPGGYTRIIKLGNRPGDNADMCIIELVDFNELLLSEKAEDVKTKGKRTRRAGSKKKSMEDEGPVGITEVASDETQADEVAATVDEEVAGEETPLDEIVTDSGDVEEEEITSETITESVPAGAEQQTENEKDEAVKPLGGAEDEREAAMEDKKEKPADQSNDKPKADETETNAKKEE